MSCAVCQKCNRERTKNVEQPVPAPSTSNIDVKCNETNMKHKHPFFYLVSKTPRCNQYRWTLSGSHMRLSPNIFYITEIIL